MSEHGTVDFATLRAALADPALADMALDVLTTAAMPGDEMAECCLCRRRWDAVGGPVAVVVLRPAGDGPSAGLLCRGCATVPRDRLVPLLAGLFAELLGDRAEVTGYGLVTHEEGHA